MRHCSIEETDNGYILKIHTSTYVYHRLSRVLEHIVQDFEEYNVGDRAEITVRKVIDNSTA